MREVVTDNTIPNYGAVDWEPFSNVQNTRSISMENNNTEVVKQTETER